MLRFRRLLLVLTALVALLPLGTALAKEIVQVTITGPGLEEAVEITDPQTLALFREIAFDEGMIVLPPTDADGPYFEIRLSIGADDQIVATDIHDYYFTSNGSYMYYAGVEGGWSDAEGTWFRLSPQSDRALRDFLADRGADVERSSVSGGWLLPLWNMILALFG